MVIFTMAMVVFSYSFPTIALTIFSVLSLSLAYVSGALYKKSFIGSTDSDMYRLSLKIWGIGLPTLIAVLGFGWTTGTIQFLFILFFFCRGAQK